MPWTPKANGNTVLKKKQKQNIPKIKTKLIQSDFQAIMKKNKQKNLYRAEDIKGRMSRTAKEGTQQIANTTLGKT